MGDDISTRVYPSGVDLDTPLLAALLHDLADEIAEGNVPIQGVMVRTSVGGIEEHEAIEDLPDCSLRVDYHPSDPELVPSIRFDDGVVRD